jgi:hypothetical protein
MSKPASRRRPPLPWSLPFLTGLLLTACATAPAQQPAQVPAATVPAATVPAAPPRTEAATHPLAAPAAAERAALNLQPTGLELGTMWTFENPPLEYWQRTYGFTATQDWLDNVRLASVRYGQGCSASFVSPDGLVMTNHHCARGCIAAVSTADVDYVISGFHASTRAEERVCPNLYLDQLIDIADVTQRIRAAAPAGAPRQQVAEAYTAEQRRVEQECRDRTGSTCQVVPLYHGGQYQLYTYRRFQPVKLVFAPELQAGYYGGDADNFTYPRYALDVTFVRAYEADGQRPAATPNYFRWRAEGAAEGEAVFITGNPGSTARLITVAQLMYERSYRHPFLVGLLAGQRQMLLDIAAQGPEQERQVREQLFGVENSLKLYRGQLEGLRDTLLVAQKIAWEREFRQRAGADAQAQPYLDVWQNLYDIQLRKLELNPQVNLSNVGLIGAPHLALAGQLAGWLRAAGLPAAERPPAYAAERFAQVQAALLQPTPISDAEAVSALALQLGLIQEWLPATHPVHAAVLRGGETPEQAARRLIAGTRVGDVAYRQALIAAGAAAGDTVSDPLFRAARTMDSIYQAVLPQWQAVAAEERVERERLARALFVAYGTRVAPDATFTLRISDGIVAGYPYNGTVAPAKTTFYGMYARAADFDGRMPWTLAESFARRRGAINMSAAVNFVSTNDITGGNSGSPVIDREARVVGIAFDGNVEQLPNEFVYRTEAGRTVAVHSAGILEALRSVYQAHTLVAELLGTGR